MSQRGVDAGLEKSMRFLDSGSRLNSPAKSLLRKSRHSQAPRSKLWLTRTGMDDTATLDHSRFSNDSFMPNKTGYNADMDLSLTVNQWELQNVDQTITHNMTNTVIKGKEPWEAVSDRLFVGFLETIQSRSSEQLFETLKDLIQACSDTLGLVQSMQKKSGKKSRQAKAEVWWLESERNTWRLLYCLYQNRMCKQTGADQMDVETNPIQGNNEKDIVAQMYKEDNDTFECQLMIDWLEKNAHDQQLDGDLPRPEYYTDKTVAWENTLHQLQNKQDSIPYRSSRPTVDHIDPDAPLREGKPLHDIDKEDEDRLMKQVFIEIRCGRMEQAQALCVHCGQPWRAAALEGWRLHHDPNYGRHGGNGEKLPVEGNPLRDVWKLCAWSVSEDRRVPPYARAAHAALCGNVAALLPVCGTWHDQLWARLRALVDVRVENEIRQNATKTSVDMPPEYWQNEVKLEAIFSELSSSADPVVREESCVPRHVVQQLLILDDVPRLMTEMADWLDGDETNPQFVRFLAHLVLVLRQLGRSDVDEVGDAVLEAYVKILLTQDNPRLVAFYVSTLPPDDQVRLYAAYLADVKDSKERQACLDAAEEVGLDVEAITKAVVENIRHKSVDGGLPDLKSEVTEEDLEKISALDWVIFYPSQRDEALYQSNALIRHFLAVGKLEAAKKALNKIPGDAIDLVIKQHQFPSAADYEPPTSSTQNLPPRLASAVREHLCYRAYVDSQDSFSDWFEHFHNAKPAAPVKPTGGEATFTERVAFDHRKKVFESELERWKITMDLQTKLVKQRLYNILLFPDGGWLMDGPGGCSEAAGETEEDRGRTQQLGNLRRLCIPSVTLLLHSVLHGMAQYTECVQLADIVVSEQYQLYKVYTKSKLAELLAKLCESSIQLMDLKKDAWGYPA